MSWQPISKTELLEKIAHGEVNMSPSQLQFWETNRIPPQKWRLHPWGDQGEGFWVVAIIGKTVLWYNDIEDGFNHSQYTTHGVIDEYWCAQDELQHLIYKLEAGCDSKLRRGPPEPLT